MNNDIIASLLKKAAGNDNVRLMEPMKLHTSIKIGGPADIMVFPQDTEALGKVIRICSEQQVPLFVMGNGSNLVVMDKGIRGVVIKLFENFCNVEVQGDSILAQAGVLLSKVSKIALQHELTGLEFAEGIPGTLGGAVAMNAGAYNGEMKDVVIKTEYLDRNGDIKILEGAQHQFGYRTSLIQKEGGLVVRSEIKLKSGSKAEIKAVMDDFSARRRDKQPLEMPSAGSVFKRPTGHFAGPMIEGCGLKGFSIGGAQVSVKHCGFIVNTGNASAEDVLRLIKHIQNEVASKYGVQLETEVRIVGEQ